MKQPVASSRNEYTLDSGRVYVTGVRSPCGGAREAKGRPLAVPGRALPSEDSSRGSRPLRQQSRKHLADEGASSLGVVEGAGIGAGITGELFAERLRDGLGLLGRYASLLRVGRRNAGGR